MSTMPMAFVIAVSVSFRYGRQYPGMLEVGEPFPVYFVTNKPDVSYAPYPPRITGFIVFGIMFTVLGATLIFFARRA